MSGPSAPPAPINLLRRTDSELTLSSGGTSTLPRQLVDQDPSTAWLPSLADTAPSLTLRFPLGTQVHDVTLTLKADAVNAAGMSEFGVRSAREWLGRAVLEASNRLRWRPKVPWTGTLLTLKLQQLPGLEGYAELEVMGTAPPEALLLDSTPPVQVAGSEPDAPLALSGWSREAPFETEQGLCAAFHRIRLSVDGTAYGDGTPIDNSRCVLGSALAPSGRTPNSVRDVRLASVEWGKGDDLGYGIEQRQVLVVRTDAGWVPGERFLTGDEGAWDSRGAVIYLDQIERPRWVHGRLQLERVRRVVISGGYPPDGPSSEAWLTVLSCGVAPKVACTEELVAFGDADRRTFGSLSEHPERLMTRPGAWHWERLFVIAPSGNIRLGRCVEHKPRTRGSAACDESPQSDSANASEVEESAP